MSYQLCCCWTLTATSVWDLLTQRTPLSLVNPALHFIVLCWCCLTAILLNGLHYKVKKYGRYYYSQPLILASACPACYLTVSQALTNSIRSPLLKRTPSDWTLSTCRLRWSHSSWSCSRICLCSAVQLKRSVNGAIRKVPPSQRYQPSSCLNIRLLLSVSQRFWCSRGSCYYSAECNCSESTATATGMALDWGLMKRNRCC